MGQLPFEEEVPWTLQNHVGAALPEHVRGPPDDARAYTAGALFVSFGLSLTLAWFVERTDMPFRNLIFVMVIAALGLPGVIAGISWVLLLSPRSGMINVFLRDIFGMQGTGPFDIYTLPGICSSKASRCFRSPSCSSLPRSPPRTQASRRPVRPRVRRSGRSCGRSRSRCSLPALLSALVYQFVSVVESFDVPLVIGLPAGIRVLRKEIYSYAGPAGGLPDYGQSRAYACCSSRSPSGRCSCTTG